MARRSADVSVKTERNPSNRDAESRSRPFTSVLLVALVVVPAFVLLLRVIVALGGDDLKWLIVWLDLLMLGALLPAAAVGIGYKVTKRVPFVVWHVALTVHLFAAATSLLVLPGWGHVAAGRHWWDSAWAGARDVFGVPASMVVGYLFGAVFMALTWLLYRIDAFRAATGANGEGGDDSGLAALMKWPKGARVRQDSIVVDDFAVTADISHANVPIDQIRGSVKALEESPHFIRGRATVIGGDKGGSSTIRLVHTDPHSVWRDWPGLSHPGGRFHEPIRTSYYSTGETQWYSFVRTPDGYRSQIAPDFSSPNGSFKGAQGATGAGKSGDAAIEQAEIFSRRDVQVVYIDTAKLLQNAGWCLEFCSLAAANRVASGYLFDGLRRLGEYRTRVLGEAGFRDFTAEAVDATGLSWIYVFADEFDVAKQNAAMGWLATKGRSVGIRFSFTLPRASGDNLDTNIRGAVGMWAQFGITQDYDKGFVLSDDTIEAGASPESFGVSVPGAHYLDRAPGVPKRMWAVDCRTYKTREDYSDLREAVLAVRSTFTPMTWTEGELKALGPVAELCAPESVRAGHLGQDDEEPPPPDDAPPGGRSVADRTGRPAEPVAHQEGTPMGILGMMTNDNEHAGLSPQARAMLDDAMLEDTADIEAQYGKLNPHEPIEQVAPDAVDDGSALPSVKPKAATPAAALADFHEALIRLHREGVREFGREEIQARMQYEMSAPEVSKRFTSLTEDATLNPPGLRLERLGRGRFTQVAMDNRA